MSVLFDPVTFEPTMSMARLTDPDTSHGAALVALRSAETNRGLALRALEAAPDGLTDFELAAKTGIQQTSIGKRRGELRDAGLVKRAVDAAGKPRTRLSPSGTPAAVWVAVPCSQMQPPAGSTAGGATGRRLDPQGE